MLEKENLLIFSSIDEVSNTNENTQIKFFGFEPKYLV